MTEFTVPDTRTPLPPAPTAGWHGGTLVELRQLPSGLYAMGWRFQDRVQDREYTLAREVDVTFLTDILVDLGLAGRKIELEDLVGSEAEIRVVTTGGKTGARVKEARPLPE